MPRLLTQDAWTNATSGAWLYKYALKRISDRQRLLLAAAVLLHLDHDLFEPTVFRTTLAELDRLRILIEDQADQRIPSALQVLLSEGVLIGELSTAALMGNADLLVNGMVRALGTVAAMRALKVTPELLGNQRAFHFTGLARQMEDSPERGRILIRQERSFAGLVREILGDRYRPTDFAASWRTSDTAGLAGAIYDDRAFDRLPILADALLDAGCDDEVILTHCRSSGLHVRGCWVVDLVLGKE
jgi:hypothetical protein